MTGAGTAIMGMGTGVGDGRASDAATQAIASPLIDEDIQGATGIIINITGPRDLGLFEVDEAAEIVQAAADPTRTSSSARSSTSSAARRSPSP